MDFFVIISIGIFPLIGGFSIMGCGKKDSSSPGDDKDEAEVDRKEQMPVKKPQSLRKEIKTDKMKETTKPESLKISVKKEVKVDTTQKETVKETKPDEKVAKSKKDGKSKKAGNSKKGDKSNKGGKSEKKPVDKPEGDDGGYENCDDLTAEELQKIANQI